MATKTYDDTVKEWWTNHFNKVDPMSLNSFFKILREEKVQMAALGTNTPWSYQIFKIIEGDILLVKTLTLGYCICYPRHEAFIRLIFPFDDTYQKEMFSYT
jgi:hypothetical protein